MQILKQELTFRNAAQAHSRLASADGKTFGLIAYGDETADTLLHTVFEYTSKDQMQFGHTTAGA